MNILRPELALALLISPMILRAQYTPSHITDTIRDVPPNATKDPSSVRLHPEYKKRLDEFRVWQDRLDKADDESAARIRQGYNAAGARLQAYIDAGKPTVLEQPPPPGNTGGTGWSAPTPTPKPPPLINQGTGGKRRTSVPEIRAQVTVYETVISEGLRLILPTSVDADSGAYALTWKGRNFSAKRTNSEHSPNITGGWRQEDVELHGSIAANGDALERLDLFRTESYFLDGQKVTTGHRLTLVDVPLHSVKQAGVFDKYRFEVRGADAVKRCVDRFESIRETGVHDKVLLLELGPDDTPIRGIRLEPALRIDLLKSKLSKKLPAP